MMNRVEMNEEMMETVAGGYYYQTVSNDSEEEYDYTYVLEFGELEKAEKDPYSGNDYIIRINY